MTILFLSHSEFLELLKKHGWQVETNRFWEDYNRIILKNKETGESFPFQYKKKYSFLFVVRTCKSLGIPPPSDHLNSYTQYEEMKNKKGGK